MHLIDLKSRGQIRVLRGQGYKGPTIDYNLDYHLKPNKVPSFEGNFRNQNVVSKIKNMFITCITRLNEKATS
jgi:hypothetical protein